MNPSILSKLEILSARHEEIAGLLAEPEVIGDQNRFRGLSMEYAQLEDVVKTFSSYQSAEQDCLGAKEMLNEDDAELRAMAEEELGAARQRMTDLEVDLQKLLLPRDPNDNSNVFLEIRAGTGGDEAAIFAGDLFRMYSRYAESCRWQVEVVSHGQTSAYLNQRVHRPILQFTCLEARRPRRYVGLPEGETDLSAMGDDQLVALLQRAAPH